MRAHRHKAKITFLCDRVPVRLAARSQLGMAAAQSRVASKRQFGPGRKDTHPVVLWIRRGWPEQERGFTQVRPVGKSGHLLRSQVVCCDHHGHRIAPGRLSGEYIDLLKLEFSHGCVCLPGL